MIVLTVELKFVQKQEVIGGLFEKGTNRAQLGLVYEGLIQ
jgi:hypothetical protein